MADEPDNLIFRQLRKIEQKIDKLSLQIEDLREGQLRLESDNGSIRGTLAALRHDVRNLLGALGRPRSADAGS